MQRHFRKSRLQSHACRLTKRTTLGLCSWRLKQHIVETHIARSQMPKGRVLQTAGAAAAITPTADCLTTYLFTYLLSRCVLEVPTETPLSEDQALKYFRDVVAGIEYRTYARSRFRHCVLFSSLQRARGKPILPTDWCSYEYFIYSCAVRKASPGGSQPLIAWWCADSLSYLLIATQIFVEYFNDYS